MAPYSLSCVIQQPCATVLVRHRHQNHLVRVLIKDHVLAHVDVIYMKCTDSIYLWF